MDNRMLIGIVVLLAVAAAAYLLVFSPTPLIPKPYSFEDGFFELSALAENRNLSIITFTEFEGSNISGFKSDLTAFKSKLASQPESMDTLALRRFTAVLEDFADYRLTVSEFNELNDEIYQVPFDELCNAVALMEQRDQTANQAIAETQTFSASLTGFVTAFPSQASAVQMSTIEFDSQGLENAKTALEESTASIKDICAAEAS